MEPDIFKLPGPIRDVTIIAKGRGLRVRQYLMRKYGSGELAEDERIGTD